MFYQILTIVIFSVTDKSRRGQMVTVCQIPCVYTTWKPQTQQHYITSAFELPILSVTSEEHHASTVSSDFVWIHVQYNYIWKGTVPSDLTGICAQATLVKQAGDDPPRHTQDNEILTSNRHEHYKIQAPTTSEAEQTIWPQVGEEPG